MSSDLTNLVPLTRATEDWADAQLEAEFARLNPEIQRRVALRVLEIDALKREVDAQMQAKLDAQSLLANLAQALGFEREDFDLSDTWGTVGHRLVDRINEMVLQNERLGTDLVALETTLAHAETFIEHQGMSYRWAEWCEGRE